jgi:histidinol-phosphatase (PHP family)
LWLFRVGFGPVNFIVIRGSKVAICSNYHTHSEFCDGDGSLEEYALSSFHKNMKYLGFSSHAPLPFQTTWTMKKELFPSYKETVSQLKEQYAERMEIFLGLEVDYIPHTISPISPEIQRMDLDYTIGSIHVLGQLPNGRYWTVDGPFAEFEEGLKHSFGGNIRKALVQYFTNLNVMVQDYSPDIIGHVDLIKRHNRGNQFFSETEEWYKALVMTSLDIIQQSNCILEVNTGGIIRKTSCSLYPSEWILHECLKRNIPITVNSDSHTPEDVNGYFHEISSILKDIGFTSIMIFTQRGWIKHSIMP